MAPSAFHRRSGTSDLSHTYPFRAYCQDVITCYNFACEAVNTPHRQLSRCPRAQGHARLVGSRRGRSPKFVARRHSSRPTRRVFASRVGRAQAKAGGCRRVGLQRKSHKGAQHGKPAALERKRCLGPCISRVATIVGKRRGRRTVRGDAGA